MVVTLSLDYRTLADKSHLIYVGLLALLLYVLFFGAVQMGARRWIPLGGFNLQPSEFAKIGVALVLAKFFGESRGAPALDRSRDRRRAHARCRSCSSRRSRTSARRSRCCRSFWRSRISPGCGCAFSACSLVCLLLAAPVAWKFALKDYQKSPNLDVPRSGAGCEGRRLPADPGAHHGRVGRASGARGSRQGTQGQLRFLPVAHNDFIFSVLAEEQGFAGVLVALGLYLFVILRALEAARLAKDRLGAYLVLGVLASFTFQVIYNITMSAGLAPVKGLTLPLMSYGGSSMIATLAGFGLILNVRMRRFTN